MAIYISEENLFVRERLFRMLSMKLMTQDFLEGTRLSLDGILICIYTMVLELIFVERKPLY